jgi:hypothetical protein
MRTEVLDPSTAEMPADAPTIDEAHFAHRWLATQTAAHPDIPEVVLRAFFECQAEPSIADLQEALGCDTAHATSWQRVLAVRLISPGHYVEAFEAEDGLTACQQQQMRYQEDCHATGQRLRELQEQIEAGLAYLHALTDGGEQAEVQDRLEALDQERVDLLRHQGDLPGVGRLIEAHLAEAQAALDAAAAALVQVEVESLQQVEEQWQAELLAALEPAVLLLTQAAWLNQAWEKQGVEPGHAHGKERLREVLLSRLRRA